MDHLRYNALTRDCNIKTPFGLEELTTTRSAMPRREFKEEDMYSGADGQEKCKQEIVGFLKGGEAAVQRLKEILPTLFAYYGIITMDAQARLIRECKLTPYKSQTSGGVTFFFTGCDVPDQFRPSRGVQREWISSSVDPDVDMTKADEGAEKQGESPSA